MLTVVQRVHEASVTVEEQTVARITQGLLILCGFAADDSPLTLQRMLDKCLNYRIFDDAQGKMNLSLKDVQGGLLLVPQFTLLADTERGLRPSFSKGAAPDHGRSLFDQLVALAHAHHPVVASGRFAADMQVQLCNNGPATFILEF